MDKTKVRGLLKDDVDEFRVIFSLVWFLHVDPSGACQKHKSLSSVFHVSKFVYNFFLWMKTENVTGNAIYVIEQSRWCRLCYSSGTYK